MNHDHLLDRNQTQTPTANGGRLVLAVHQATFLISMVVVMVAAFALTVFLGYALGLETTRIGLFPGYFLALGGLLAFLFFWSAIVTALQGWLIKRYSGVVPARNGKMWVPPYWRRDRGQEAEELQPSLYNNAPGARSGRKELATLVCVAPVTAAVSIICGFVLMYILRLDYVILIGLTAGLGGQLAFFMLVARLLWFDPSARFEMTSQPSTLLVRRDH